MPQKRVIFTLPPALLTELERFAKGTRGGNKSGFVADALSWYITHLKKTRYTAKLRDAYSTSAKEAAGINHQWEGLDEDTWPD